MLYNLIITPIETIVGWVFFFFNNKFEMLGPAGSIIGVSLVINFLALPLYNIADSLQEKERKLQKSLEYRVKRIKKGFKGDEQFMMLQTYYRQNNYHPLYALRSSLSILIEIPFFIAAYHYLSNCEALKGVSFLFLKDLGSPDHVFSIPFGQSVFYINILPVIMTGINLISGAVYSKEAPVREKVQIYVLAAIFLVLLYNSPSGLVFYWILNNLFSLLKNIIKKLPNPGKIMHVIISVLMIAFVIFFFITRPSSRIWKKMVLTLFTIVIVFIPLEIKLYNKLKSKIPDISFDSSFGIFIFSCISLAILCGFVLPVSVIASSPIEFSFLGNTPNPISYIISSITVFSGLFILWPLVIYKLFSQKTKNNLTCICFCGLILSIFDVFFMKSTYGELNAFFIFSDTSSIENISKKEFLLPLLCLLMAFVIYQLFNKLNKKQILSVLIIAVSLAETVYGFSKIKNINTTYKNYSSNIASEKETYLEDKIKPFYHLSKTQPNVVVIFLDRAMSALFQRTIDTYPEIKDAYTGFVFYPNTISFGTGTDSGSPGLMGGYEYTPYNMNLRDDEPMVKKHNESTLVLPKIFLDANYNVTVVNPPWPNYEWRGDLSAFEPYPEIKVAELGNSYSYTYSMEMGINLFNEPDKKCRINIRNFSIMQAIPPFLREFFYKNCYRESFVYLEYIDDISQLHYLPELTDFTSDKPTYTFIDNETTHNWIMMEEPDFDKPLLEQDNFSKEQKQYHTNITAYKKITRWLEYLKEQGCYDNTRIIIVSDHGKDIGIEEFKAFEDISSLPEHTNCTFLYKDFNSNGPLQIDATFMTNADTPLLAIDKLSVSDINPFTGKKLTSQKEGGVTIYETIDTPMDHVKTTFKINTENIYHVNGDVRNPENWVKVEVE